MSLFGDKCARCGVRTRHEVEGQATCIPCEQEIQLLLDAKEEDLRVCPIDGTTMAKEVAHMIVIDRCPGCKGVWLDGGELEKMRGGVEASAIMAVAGGMTSPLG